MYVILARQPRICTDVFENIVRVSILRKLVACCKTREFTNRLCYRSVVLDWFLAVRTLLSCVFLLYWLLILSEYTVVNVFVFISEYCCICTNSFATRVLSLEVGGPNSQ